MALEFAAEEYRAKKLSEIQKNEKLLLDAMQVDMQETQYQKRTDDRITDAGDRMLLNTEGLIRTILNQRLNGEEVGRLAYFFHEELARQITAICVRIREGA